jgi:hypothetical protein
MVLAIEGIDLDSRSCHQGWRIHDFEPVVGEADDLLLAKDLQRPADVNAIFSPALTAGSDPSRPLSLRAGTALPGPLRGHSRT